MAGARKSPDEQTPPMAEQPGVAETGAVFGAPVRDRWTIARERLAEYRRTGETISMEEAMAELDRLIAERRAAKG